MVTRKQFEKYVEIQHSGITNMMDVNRVINISRGILNRSVIMDIMKDYGTHEKKYSINMRTMEKSKSKNHPNAAFLDEWASTISDLVRKLNRKYEFKYAEGRGLVSRFEKAMYKAEATLMKLKKQEIK